MIQDSFLTLQEEPKGLWDLISVTPKTVCLLCEISCARGGNSRVYQKVVNLGDVERLFKEPL
jgi:hypothetical protein